MFETLTVITISLILFFAWQNQQLGLTATVPKDPMARAHWQASQCLETFKGKLVGATLNRLEETRLRVTLKDSSAPTDFWCDEGNVFEQAVGEDKPQLLHTLGPAGSLHFRKLSEPPPDGEPRSVGGRQGGVEAIFVRIVAGSSARHEIGLRVEVKVDASLSVD